MSVFYIVKHRLIILNYLFLHGHIGDNITVEPNENGQAKDILVETQTVGAEGGDPLPTFKQNLALAVYTTTVDEVSPIETDVSSSGGGCTYNPNNKE